MIPPLPQDLEIRVTRAEWRGFRLGLAVVLVALLCGLLGWWAGRQMGQVLGQWEMTGIERQIDPVAPPAVPPGSK